MRVLNDYPQEARLLAIDFEETSAHQVEQAEKQNKKNPSPSGSGRIHSNISRGGEFETEEAIGDDDEVDWKLG